MPSASVGGSEKRGGDSQLRPRITTYRDLKVWKESVSLATEICKITRGFPVDERFALTSQIRRAATSVPANIAEGAGRGSTKEFIQFLTVSRGSLLELETHLIIARNLNYLTAAQLDPLMHRAGEIGRMLNGLVRALRRNL